MNYLTWDQMPTACKAFESGILYTLKDGHAFVNCGSRWAGEKSATLLELLKVMRDQQLDTRRIIADECRWMDDTQPPKGTWIFCGNFINKSFGFSVYTDSRRCIDVVRAAMMDSASKTNV